MSGTLIERMATILETQLGANPGHAKDAAEAAARVMLEAMREWGSGANMWVCGDQCSPVTWEDEITLFAKENGLE